jgi:class III poly(R)-hydroxyalkanoic acid synthase PhaE subunit
MADKAPGAGWSKDWEALNKQMWSAWTEAARQAGGADTMKMPWHEGLESWSRLFAPQSNAQSDVVERMMSGARQFLGMAQAAAQTASGKTPMGSASAWSDMLTQALGGLSQFNNPMLDAMRGIAGEGAMGWEQLAAETHKLAGPMKAELGALLSLPTFGYQREQQERQQKLGAAMAEYQEWFARYNGLMLKASQRAFEQMERKLAERSEPGREVGTLRGVYDLWVDAAEEGYAEVALSPEFRKAYGELVNAQMRVRKLVNAEIERSTQGVGMPTRTELDAVHARLADMRRRLSRLEEAVDAEEAQPREAASPAPARSKTKSKPAQRARKGNGNGERQAAARASAPQAFAERLAATRAKGRAKPKDGRK